MAEAKSDDPEPVADLHPVAVDRQPLPRERVEDAERDQLLRVLTRPVVVGGADDQRLGLVGLAVGADHHVAAGLRGRVGRGRVDRRALGERALVDRAVDLVGGDLEVADAGGARRFEQHVGPVDVGLDELSRGLDRAVDVGLGGEVDDRLAALDRGLDRLGVGDVGDDQLEPLGVEPLEVLLAPGVGELVEHPDPELGMGLEPVADVGGADEPGPPGDQHVHTPALASRADRYSLSPCRHSGRVIGSGRSEASSESGGRGAGRPSISVVPDITRVSKPA